jgi:hypothetical protein
MLIIFSAKDPRGGPPSPLRGGLARVPPGLRPAGCPRGGVLPAVLRDSSTY